MIERRIYRHLNGAPCLPCSSLLTSAERDFIAAISIWREMARFELKDRERRRPMRTIRIPKIGRLVRMTLTGDIK
jgi:hypothetical protein